MFGNNEQDNYVFLTANDANYLRDWGFKVNLSAVSRVNPENRYVVYDDRNRILTPKHVKAILRGHNL